MPDAFIGMQGVNGRTDQTAERQCAERASGSAERPWLLAPITTSPSTRGYLPPVRGHGSGVLTMRVSAVTAGWCSGGRLTRVRRRCSVSSVSPDGAA
jgi:hypothetical protein